MPDALGPMIVSVCLPCRTALRCADDLLTSQQAEHTPRCRVICGIRGRRCCRAVHSSSSSSASQNSIRPARRSHCFPSTEARSCQRVTHLGEGDGDGSGLGDSIGLCNHPFHHMLDPTHRWHAGGTWEKMSIRTKPLTLTAVKKSHTSEWPWSASGCSAPQC